MNIKYLAVLLSFFLFLPMGACPLCASSALEFQVVRISSQDRAAVIRSPENKLSVIKAGSRIEGVGKVAEIAENRVVIEAPGDRGGETLIIRLEGGRQRTERIRKAGHRRPLFYAPEGARGP
jgi:hypothetical protein